MQNLSVIQTRTAFTRLGCYIGIRRRVRPDDIVARLKSTRYSKNICLALETHLSSGYEGASSSPSFSTMSVNASCSQHIRILPDPLYASTTSFTHPGSSRSQEVSTVRPRSSASGSTVSYGRARFPSVVPGQPSRNQPQITHLLQYEIDLAYCSSAFAPLCSQCHSLKFC